MTKNEEIQALLAASRDILLHGEPTNGLCFDGIVDEVCFARQPVKLAVLLKETNGNDENGGHREVLSDWDYRSWLKEQQAEGTPMPGETKDPFYSSTFRKLCLWLSIFSDIAADGTCDRPRYFLPDGGVDVQTVRASLKKAAIVNLKKTWGTERTDPVKLYRYATHPLIAPILRRELEIIAPDVVLCGSSTVFEAALELYGLGADACVTEPSQTLPGRSMRYAVDGGMVFIDFFHPAWYGKEDAVLAAYAEEVFTWVLRRIR